MLHYYLIVDIIIEILLQVQNEGTMLNLYEHIMLTYNISRMGYTGSDIQNMLCFMITSSHTPLIIAKLCQSSLYSACSLHCSSARVVQTGLDSL